MSRTSSLFSQKWLPNLSVALISIVSAIVFFLLDLLDVVMCMFFRVFDELLEGKSSSCYCLKKEVNEEEGEGDDLAGESELLSCSLHGRKNVFREMGLLRITRKESAFCEEEGEGERSRWSDCGCESCVSWMSKGSDSRLHFVVNEPHIARQEYNSEETTVQNVIFIHGFLSSSSMWKEAVFPNLSEESKQKYKLYAVDLLGFGRSPKPRNCFYTLKDHLEMIEKSVILPFQLKSFHLVAHSMGCVVALALAAKYSDYVESITLTAPPYFSCSEGDASLKALKKLAPRTVWPPLLFGSAFMSWYEHLGRCICFLICRNHKTWEWILKLLSGRRELHFAIMDLTRHTHHSAWHSMHNVICGGAKYIDKYLETLSAAKVKIHVIQGTKDQVVPLECSYNLKMKDPNIEIEVVPNTDHTSVIIGRERDFCRNIESIWESTR